MNRLESLFSNKYKEILNVYFTAGHPTKDATQDIIYALEQNGVDLIEVGIPYSDPMADGETIQKSSAIALSNGMNLSLLFQQVKDSRRRSNVPIVLMGYYNQMLQFGIEKFLKQCQLSGVDGLIIPDLPMSIYKNEYIDLFDKYDVKISFLITPETSDERIRLADELSNGFIYVVSKSSITGTSSNIDDAQKHYFERIEKMKLNTPRLIGFGIHDKKTYQTACNHSQGAIIGSAFIRTLNGSSDISKTISEFINRIR